jgi:hypothetical protein
MCEWTQNRLIRDTSINTSLRPFTPSTINQSFHIGWMAAVPLIRTPL